MLHPYIDGEPRLPAGPRRRQGLRPAARPCARGGRLGRGARRAARPARDARAHAAARAARAGRASRRTAGRTDAASGARPRRGARDPGGGGRLSAGGVRGGRCRRRGARSPTAGAAGRVAAVGIGGGAPPRGPRADPRPGRAGRSHRMTTGDDVQLVTFKVAGQDLAFNIFQVERILRYEAPAPLPKAPDFLEGVLRYQGVAVPLVDLRKRLSLPAPLREETRTVILEWEGGKLGVIVDAVTEVLHVAAPEITSPPTIVKGLAAEYITGLVVKDGRTSIVLNTARRVRSEEKLAIQALQKALQLSPGETQAESLLGWAQMLHEDYDDALGTFQKVLMKEPANSLARINVGYICLKKRIFGEAIEHLSKAIRLDNDKK